MDNAPRASSTWRRSAEPRVHSTRPRRVASGAARQRSTDVLAIPDDAPATRHARRRTVCPSGVVPGQLGRARRVCGEIQAQDCHARWHICRILAPRASRVSCSLGALAGQHSLCVVIALVHETRHALRSLASISRSHGGDNSFASWSVFDLWEELGKRQRSKGVCAVETLCTSP